MTDSHTVTRVQDPNGSHIEPPLDPTWDEPTKLAWKAAVVAHDSGLTIEVRHHGDGSYGIRIGDLNSVGGQSVVGRHTFQSAWEFLVGISIGVTHASCRITDATVRAAAEAIEDECLRRLGRDLGTIHRDDIVRVGLEAAARAGWDES